MRKRRRSSGVDAEQTGIDLAPMLDFVVNLLIFFIITAVFVKESGLEVNRPTSFEQPEESDNESIQIQILDNGEPRRHFLHNGKSNDDNNEGPK